MKRVAIFVLAASCPELCFAMPTSEFVSRWAAASNNPRHLNPEAFANQPEVKTLIAELGKAGDNYKAQLAKARADHTALRSCPPTDVNLQLKDLLAAAKKLPPEWQSREFTDSFARIMDERYPCHQTGNSG